MDSIQQNRLEEKIRNGYDFPAATYINQGWEYFKKFAGGFIGFFFLSIFIGLALGIIPTLGFILSTFIVGPALKAGYYIITDKIIRGNAYDFGDFFKGFDYLWQLALATLAMYFIFVIVLSPTLYALHSEGMLDWYLNLFELQNPMEGLPPVPELSGNAATIFLLNLVPLLYLFLAYLFTIPFIIFHKMSFWDAMETSRRLITRKWFSVFLLFLQLFGLFLLFYIPVIFLGVISPLLVMIAMLAVLSVVPAIYCIVFAAFADVTDLYDEPDGEGSELIDHLIE